MDTISIPLKKENPEEIVVVNGQSWKCPVYVRRLPPCRGSCPAGEDIRGYLTLVAQAQNKKMPEQDAFDAAWYLLTDKNPFPAVHGRICPHPCESGCNRKYKDTPVAINNFERAIGDHGLRRGLKLKTISDAKQNKKVAVVGSGPSGMSCAYQLARRGYSVTVFEAAEKPGGMLRYGIPSYRLPKEILDAEIKNILDLGVELRCGVRIGTDVSFQELRNTHDAVYIAVGAQKGGPLGIPGDNLPAVMGGVEFLGKLNRGEKPDVGKRTVIVGGGNTAIDAARTSRRLGADVTLLYRRTRNEMPAIAEEIEEAAHEGVNYRFLAAPVNIESVNGGVRINCIGMKLGEKDASGRSRPVPVTGSEFWVEADSVIAAIGQEPVLKGMEAVPTQKGWVQASSTFETGLKGVFAGGDAVVMDLAVTAVGHGRKAARTIEAYLNGQTLKAPPPTRPISYTVMDLSYYPNLPRHEEKELSVEARVRGFEEVNQTIAVADAVDEAKRCLSCGLCFECDRCRVYCPREAVSKDRNRSQGKAMFTDYTRCSGCHICAEVCPCGYIEMGMGL